MTKNQLTLLWVLALLCMTQGVEAQNNSTTNLKTHSEIFDDQFVFNPNAVPFGYLYDRVYPTADLEHSETCDTINQETILQAYWELENSNLNPTEDFVFDAFQQTIQIATLRPFLPIIAIDYQTSAFDSMAFHDGRINIQDDQYFIDPSQNPYHTFRTQMATFARNSIEAETDYQCFLDPQFFKNNTGTQPISAQITNFESNEVFNLTLNDTIVLTFDNEIDVRFGIQVELSDGSIICNQFATTVKPKLYKTIPECQDGFMFLVESDIPFKGLMEQDATTSIADAHVYYHKTPENPCKIMKPIIIVDGFDPLDIRGFEDIYKVVSYDNSNLIKDMQDQGYDVIVMNFPVIGSEAIQFKSEVKQFKNGSFDRFVSLAGRDGGADYIERNAFLTVKLIQMVNDILVTNESTEELVVIGPSMGGLVTRFALAYMEKEHANGTANMDHNTRLWVSFDAPQDGANIPISTQIMVDFFGHIKGDQDVKNMFTQRLRSVAARQLLVHTYDRPHIRDFKCQEHHDLFYTALKQNGTSGSNGWPQNLRKVSVLNGNLDGIQTFVSGASDIKMSLKKNNLDLFKVDMKYGPNTNETAQVFEGLYTVKKWSGIGSNSFNFNFQDGISGELTTEQKLTVYQIGTKVFYHNSSSKGPLDIVPGALYPAVNEISDKLVAKVKAEQKSGFDLIINNLGSNFTFIPSLSAAGLLNPNISFDTDLGTTNLPCAGLTHFDNIFVPSKDEYHLQVTSANAKWILQEVERGAQGCEKMCAESDGWPTYLCKGSSTDLKLKNLPTNSNYSINWATENAFSVNSGQGTNTANIKANNSSNTNPNFRVVAWIIPTCAADQFISASIEIPNTFADISGSDKICSFHETYAAKTTSTIQNPTWYYGDIHGTYQNSNPYSSIVPPSNYTDDSGQNYTDFDGYRVGNYTLYFEANNLCGESIQDQFNVAIVPKSTCNDPLKGFADEDLGDVSIYPNPTADNWTLHLTSPTDRIVQLVLYDMNGQLVQSIKNEQDLSVIDLNGAILPNGFYFLRITTTNGETYTQRLVKRPAGL